MAVVIWTRSLMASLSLRAGLLACAVASVYQICESSFDHSSVLFQLDQHCLLENILTQYFAVTLDRFDPFARIGQRSLKLLIRRILITEATLEPPAHPRQS